MCERNGWKQGKFKRVNNTHYRVNINKPIHKQSITLRLNYFYNSINKVSFKFVWSYMHTARRWELVDLTRPTKKRTRLRERPYWNSTSRYGEERNNFGHKICKIKAMVSQNKQNVAYTTVYSDWLSDRGVSWGFLEASWSENLTFQQLFRQRGRYRRETTSFPLANHSHG